MEAKQYSGRRGRHPAGLAYLNQAADGGSIHAMVELAEGMLLPNATPASRQLGYKWLRRAADFGSVPAMVALGARLLEDTSSQTSNCEGIGWLKQAADWGSLQGATELGISLILGDGVSSDIARGEVLLATCAARGDRLARLFLSYSMKVHDSTHHGPIRGDTMAGRWATDGLDLYVVGASSRTPRISRRLCKQAGICFLEGHLRGDRVSSVNLAYLKRRSEDYLDSSPPLETLLARPLEEGDSFARVNQALRLAQGVDCPIDWRAADALIAGLSQTTGIKEWWLELFKKGDSEGDLVLAWLVRHGLSVDPEGKSAESRFAELAPQWSVPRWLH